MPARSAASSASPATPPDERALHEAAMAHVARYATTRAGLVRVLDRRVDRWARAVVNEVEPDVIAAAVAEARAAVRAVAARMESLGAIDDAAFAASRARSLVRAGRSRLAVSAHLAARGVAKEVVSAALPDAPEAELAAAVALARRRRLGPFRRAAADGEARRRELAVLARAGFPQDIASRALDMAPDAAEALLLRLRQTLLDDDASAEE